MVTTTVDEIELAIKIGDNSKSLSVAGKTKEETRHNLLKLFTGKDDKTPAPHYPFQPWQPKPV
jgi:hypothetical protein